MNEQDLLTVSFMAIATVCAAVLVAKFVEQLFFVSGSNRPPCYSGWWPFIGCALEFGRGPLTYIEKSRLEMGPVFTLYIAGRRMTFLTDPEDYSKYFMQSEYVDFQKGVQPFVQNAASIHPDCFMKYHTTIHDMMKGKLAMSNLPALQEDLWSKFTTRLEEMNLTGGDHCEYELNDLVRRIMYPAVIKNLFGDDVLPITDEEKVKELVTNFKRFDDQFEYGTQLPQFLLGSWAASKKWLLNMFQQAITRKDNSTRPTILQALYDTVEGNDAPNYGLLMLWASLANAIPITYWTILYILNHEKVLARVNKEIAAAENKGDFTAKTLVLSTPYIKCCFLEAIRLRSPGTITRLVVKPFSVKGYNVPAGDMIFISPYWSHRNHDTFPEPDIYNPDRWLDADLEKNVFLPGFVAFGGGRYMCPGRWYALMELHMLLAIMFKKYDMKLTSKVPPPVS